ncbi:hypothetical protein GmRootA79_42330 [Acidovorax sp. A79]
MPRGAWVLTVWAMIGAGAAAAAAQAADQGSTEAVYTRARVVSVDRESGSGGKKLYVRLKLLPRAKIPFATQTFRVVDASLLAGISEGAWVRFQARRVDGENTLTAIHIADECKRFEPCD